MIPSSQRFNLVSLCETSWVERYEAVIVFVELFAAILHALQEIENSDELASGNAERLKLRILTLDFIYNLKILEHILAITLSLSTASCLTRKHDIPITSRGAQASGIMRKYR